jgi:hypothetical protein
MTTSQLDAHLTNGHNGHAHPPATAKKSKGKKNMPNDEASRLLHARISQLEQDAAGEKDQELEIEREKIDHLPRDAANSWPICDDWSARIRRTSDVEITYRRREMQAEPN